VAAANKREISMRCNHFKRALTAWACASAVALLSGSAAVAELPRHPAIQTLEALPEEVQPIPDERPQSLMFGQSVAIRNGTAFVGMPEAFGNDGRVAIFTRTANGWQRTGTLDPPANEFSFGRSLTFRDGYVIVGAASATYVFRSSGGQWILSQRLARPAGDTASDFARAIHYESGILLVGAPNANGSGRREAAYVYERDATGKLVFRTALTPADGHGDDWFGLDVSVASGVIVIGAPRSDSTGAAYVFRRNSNGTWVQRQKLVSSEAEASDQFGWSVAIDRGMIVVGAPNVDLEGFPGEPPTPDDHVAGGAAYGFVPVAGSFVETFKLRPRPDENFEYVEFGTQVEMFDRRIVVAAFGSQIDITRGGFVHTYSRDGSTVTALGLARGFLESASLGLANQWLLVGSPLHFQCHNSDFCIGEANLFDLNRFAQ
jgi:FG-GAP repeat